MYLAEQILLRLMIMMMISNSQQVLLSNLYYLLTIIYFTIQLKSICLFPYLLLIINHAFSIIIISPKIQPMLALRNIIKPSALGYSGFNLLQKYSFGLIKFNLPDLGQKIKEGTIKKLYVKQGDAVEQFQKIADVASDKQFTELTASNSGVIRKIYYKEEDVCQVGDLFLEIFVEESGKTASTEKQQAETHHKAQNPKVQKKQVAHTERTDILASPYVRGLIKKYNLQASKIQGSGQAARILQVDIEAILNKKNQVKDKPKEQKPHHVQAKPQKHQKEHPKPSYTTTSVEAKNIAMSSFEKGMQKSMTESNTIPHLYLHEEFDITQVERMRKSLKQSNKKVTVMGILIKTFSLALKQYPRMNSLYHPGVNPYEYSIHSSHNVSIAIDSPNGLVVPFIKSVNTLNLGDIQQQLERLRNLAKEAKLTSKQLQGGTICLSNIGTIGGTHACPLILPPQVCIVAIGKLQSVPKYKNGQLVERKIINISYGCDHRVIDGATAARFSNHWKQLIQNPYLSIAQMI